MPSSIIAPALDGKYYTKWSDHEAGRRRVSGGITGQKGISVVAQLTASAHGTQEREPIVDAELSIDAFDMLVHGPGRDRKPGGDLCSGVTVEQQDQDTLLPPVSGRAMSARTCARWIVAKCLVTAASTGCIAEAT